MWIHEQGLFPRYCSLDAKFKAGGRALPADVREPLIVAGVVGAEAAVNPMAGPRAQRGD